MSNGKMHIVVCAVVAILCFSFTLLGTDFTRNVEDRVQIDRDGTGRITRTEWVSGDELVAAYTERAQTMQKDRALYDELIASIATELYGLYGTRPSPDSIAVQDEVDDRGNFVRETATAVLPGLVRKSENGRELDVRKFSDAQSLADYCGSVLEGLTFSSMLLGEKEGGNRLLIHKTTFIAFEGGESLFIDPKQVTSWAVDLGGGSGLSASLTDTGKGTLTLAEETILTDSPPSELLREENGEAVSQLAGFAAFRVGVASPLGQDTFWPAWQESSPKGWVFYPTLDRDWNTTFPIYNGEAAWGGPCEGTSATLSVKPTIQANVSISVELHLKAKLTLFSHGHIVSWTITEFTASANARPAVTSALLLEVVGQPCPPVCELNGSTNMLNTSLGAIYFWIGPMPVWVNFGMRIDALAHFRALGCLSITASKMLEWNVGGSLEWTKASGWQNVPLTATYIYHPFLLSATAKVGADAWLKLQLTLDAYFFGVCGPYLQVVPSLWAKVEEPPDTPQFPDPHQAGYAIGGGVDVVAGVSVVGWLASYLATSSWAVPLAHWTFPTITGQLTVP